MSPLAALLPDASCDPALARLASASKPHFWSEGYRVRVHPNGYASLKDDPYATWSALIESGRSYLVGSTVPMERFLATHRSPLTAWQKIAYDWALAHPELELRVTNSRFEWRIGRRGESVLFDLPHHDFGGEEGYASRDGRTKIHINSD